MYNIKILNECNDENIRAAIISAVLTSLVPEDDLIVTKLKRGKIEVPVWSSVSGI